MYHNFIVGNFRGGKIFVVFVVGDLTTKCLNIAEPRIFCPPKITRYNYGNTIYGNTVQECSANNSIITTKECSFLSMRRRHQSHVSACPAKIDQSKGSNPEPIKRQHASSHSVLLLWQCLHGFSCYLLSTFEYLSFQPSHLQDFSETERKWLI